MADQLGSDWSFISREDADFEVETQTNFCFWIADHPEARFLDGEPSLNFSKHLQVGLCGLLWHLQHDPDERRGWSFAIRTVHPCDAVPFASGESVSPPARDEFHNPFSNLLRGTAHEAQLSQQLDKLGFDCAETVENAESFCEVLDALFRFSSWYGEQERDVQGNMKAEDFPFVCTMLDDLWASQCRHLEIRALEAAEMCQLAKSSLQEASEAMAALLVENFASATRVHDGELWDAPAQCLWAKSFMRKRVLEHGSVLQWCTVEFSDYFAHCTLDLSELLVEESQIAAALSVGIAPTKSLTIKFDNQGDVVRVSQELSDDDGSVSDGGDEAIMIKTSCNDGLDAPSCFSSWVEPEADPTKKRRKKNQLHLGIEFLVRSIVRQSARPGRKTEYDEANNVFVKTLQDVASHLGNLGQVCVICGAPRMWEWYRLPGTCNDDVCQSTFAKWKNHAPMELEELELPPVYSLMM